MSRRLYLVRHGQTTWNVEGRLQGQSAGGELTDLGRQQAQQAAIQLRDCGAKYLIVSDARRAQQSAVPIAAALGLAPELEPLLREQYFGEMEGRLRSELHAEETPPGWQITDIRWGGGESVADVYRRWTDFLDVLAKRPEGDAVVVSHGVMIRVAHGWAHGQQPHEIDWVECPNGSITVVEVA